MKRSLSTTSTVRAVKLTAAQKQAHVQAYLNSGLGSTAYCQRHGLKVTTFKNWVTRYQDRSKLTSHFVSAVLAPPKVISPALNTSASRIEIHHRGCKVVVCEFSNVTTLVELIQGMLQCN